MLLGDGSHESLIRAGCESGVSVGQGGCGAYQNGGGPVLLHVVLVGCSVGDDGVADGDGTVTRPRRWWAA